MFRFKSCPICPSGDLEEKAEDDGHHQRCVRCGKQLEQLISLPNEFASKQAGR